MTSPLRVFVVDDEALARTRMKQLLEDCHQELPVVCAGEADNGFSALQALKTQVVDVVLVDIHMPEMDGLELAKRLSDLPHPPAVIFSTAYDDYAIKAFELAATDYILKPVRLNRLLEALRRIKPVLQDAAAPLAHGSFLSVIERGRVILVPLDDILYMKAELKYITVVTEDKEYLLEGALTQLEHDFPERFVRIHRNCLVSSAQLHGFERTGEVDGEPHWQAVLKNGMHLPVSRRQWQVLRGMLKSG
ncbi:LytR/AlgR family response regulator transcription factor [Leeia oryzae]|uniref:LytR/AlgR family response regulator transcription factor n=1 Tax=Leeia oryzae TaxID=356662 RepID=UPI00036DD69E|nr:LytTR family DNA-binding domain-containing protein [Leeia oryzae]